MARPSLASCLLLVPWRDGFKCMFRTAAPPPRMAHAMAGHLTQPRGAKELWNEGSFRALTFPFIYFWTKGEAICKISFPRLPCCRPPGSRQAHALSARSPPSRPPKLSSSSNHFCSSRQTCRVSWASFCQKIPLGTCLEKTCPAPWGRGHLVPIRATAPFEIPSLKAPFRAPPRKACSTPNQCAQKKKAQGSS